LWESITALPGGVEL